MFTLLPKLAYRRYHLLKIVRVGKVRGPDGQGGKGLELGYPRWTCDGALLSAKTCERTRLDQWDVLSSLSRFVHAM